MANRLVIGIVKSSTDIYVPKNEPCKILLNERNHPIAVHRVLDGAGTVLDSMYDRTHTTFDIVREIKTEGQG
jgi:hypothetical protein